MGNFTYEAHLVDLRGLPHWYFLILHVWQNLVDFTVAFLWITLLFSMSLFLIIFLRLFGR